MKIIIAKRSGYDETVYINASRINSFHAVRNPFSNDILETKIYFTEGKCAIEGDRTEEIANFMGSESDCGILDLVKDKTKKTYWSFKGGSSNVTTAE